MTVKLSDLLGTRTIEVSVLGVSIDVTYRLSERTVAKIETESMDTPIADELVRFVESWTLLGDDGLPVPITAEDVRRLPLPVARRIYNRILSDDGLGEVSSSSGAS